MTNLDELKRCFGRSELFALAETEDLVRRGSGRNRSECPQCRNGDPRGVSIGESNGVGVWNCHRDEKHRGTAIDFLAFSRSLSVADAIKELRRRIGEDPPAKPSQARSTTDSPPPAVDVSSLWSACKPITLEEEVASAWESRAITVAHVEDRDLARALPRSAHVPRWAGFRGQPWSAWPHRLIVPMYDERGRLRSLHSRAAQGQPGIPKGLSPAGYAVAGLVMADPLARLLLAGLTSGDGEPAADLVRRCGLVVCEGVPDFLTWATRWGDAAESAPAIIGIISGSWTTRIAERIPSGTSVFVRTHADDAGTNYGKVVASSLEARCPVRLAFADEGGLVMFKDDNDRLRAGVLPTDPAEGTVPAPSSWPDLIPLETPPVPPFPTAVLPDWQRVFVEAAAIETETSPDLGALAVLSAQATALQGKMVVEQRLGFSQPLCLWTMSLLKSGGRKSRVFKLATSPLEQWQARKAQEMGARIASEASAKRRLDQRLRRAEKCAADAKNEEQRKAEESEADRLAQKLASFEVTRAPVLFITEGTPERIEEMLCEQGQRMAVLSDENAMLELLSGRYSRGAPHLSSLNSAHEGGAVRVARKRRDDGTGGDRILEHAHVTFGLSVQPERVFAELKHNNAFFDSGFAWRFLFALVRSTLGERTHRTPTTPDHVLQAYADSMAELLDLPLPIHSEVPIIRLEPDAREALLEWESGANEPRMRPGGDLENLTSWGSKLASRLCRVAALFHPAETPAAPWDQPLSLATMQRALALAPYFIAHVKAVAFEINADPVLRLARRAVSWLRREGKASFTHRELHRGVAKDEPSATVDPVLRILEDRGFIRPLPKVPGEVGRPSPRFLVNPRLLQAP